MLRSALFQFLLTTLTFTLIAARPTEPLSELVTRKDKPAPKPAPPKPRANNNTYLAPAPRWVIYTDEGLPNNQVVPPVEDLDGFNVLILAFYMSNGPSDQVSNWKALSNKTRTEIVKDYHAHNVSIMMSLFGALDSPTTNGTDPVKFAKEVGDFVKEYQLDGVDIDWEDFKSLNRRDGSAEAWITNLTLSLRTHLPNDSYFLTHAPVAPWFTTNEGTYPHGAYRSVAIKANSSIDWFNIQYYNQDNMYTTCEHLLTKSPGGGYPDTSILEIHNNTGVPLEKLVVGKPARKNDAYKGMDYMTPADEAACLEKAKKELKWNAGAMFWEYHGKVEQVSSNAKGNQDDEETGAELSPNQLIKQVRGSAFPILKLITGKGKGSDDDN